MRESDFDSFVAMLDDVAAMLNHGKALTSGHKAMFFRAVAEHSLADVRRGFDGHVKDPMRGRFMPAPADVLAQIQGLADDDGRPGVEEAWAVSLRARDEAATVVWTEEMSQAWGECGAVLGVGDEIGARMAFKEIYGRLLADARRSRKPARWVESIGFDPSQRGAAIEQATRMGRLPAPEATLALPAPEKSLDMLAAAAPPETREKLAALRAAIVVRASGPTAAELDRQRTSAQKRAAAERVNSIAGTA